MALVLDIRGKLAMLKSFATAGLSGFAEAAAGHAHLEARGKTQ
jgi:hypothetical protein